MLIEYGGREGAGGAWVTEVRRDGAGRHALGLAAANFRLARDSDGASTDHQSQADLNDRHLTPHQGRCRSGVSSGIELGGNQWPRP